MLTTAPTLSISPEKVCFFIDKAHQYDVKDAVSDPDSGSNDADDMMLDVLEDHLDDLTVHELTAFIRQQVDLHFLIVFVVECLEFLLGRIIEWNNLREEA